MAKRVGDYAPIVVTATAFTAVSTAAVALSSGNRGKFVVLMTPTQACYVKFGDASVGAATSSDFPLVANQTYRFVCSDDTNNFRVIRNAADGTLSWYIAGKAS